MVRTAGENAAGVNLTRLALIVMTYGWLVPAAVGTVIGKALRPLARGCGLIPILVVLR